MYTQDETALRGLLLSDVLLEECETLDYGKVYQAFLMTTYATDNTKNLAAAKEEASQPPADQLTQQAGEPQTPTEGKSLEVAAQAVVPLAQQETTSFKEELAEASDAERVKQIYRWMRDDLGRAAIDEEKERKRDFYKQRYQLLFNYLSAENLTKVLDHAVAAYFVGYVHYLESKFQRVYAKESNKDARKLAVETALLNAIKMQALGEVQVGPNGIVAADDDEQSPDITVEEAVRLASRTQRSALCLSGGGIRSATFNLGILQGLARHGLLEKFDYLSTVSGGGFIGGWLTAWIHRQGLESVVKHLSEPPKSPLKPEPEAIEQLRIYSNYLSPRSGLLSADTWTLVASVLRNLVLNWLVFIPMLVVFLLLPRVWTAVLLPIHNDSWFYPSFIGGSLAGIWSLAYIFWQLPRSTAKTKPIGDKYKAADGPFIYSCLAWMTGSAALLAISFWSRMQQPEAAVLNQHPLLYASLSVPLILLGMCVVGTLIDGFLSRFTNDDAQEWWARAGAWVLIVAVFWVAIHMLVLCGPLMILNLGATYEHLSYKGGITSLPWKDIGKLAGTMVGVLSGIITLLGGFSGKTPANAKEAKQASAASLALSSLTTLVAPVFLVFVFIVVALGTDWLLVSIGPWANKWGTGLPLPSESVSLSKWHMNLLEQTPLPYLGAVAFSLIAFAGLMGRFINTNKFSLQYLWRNRIVRAYLGASHVNRKPQPFTGFDSDDNVQMHELRAQPVTIHRPKDDAPQIPPSRKLFHVLNIALNLTGGKKLQWQDRRAESFTVSPLHAGSYWLGYRRSSCYGGENGVSLGAAVAISGAFVSPNMGYMMTSPVVRFLMTLFNVRFGFWLGNPGPVGDKLRFKRLRPWPVRAFQLGSPRLSVKPIVSEAFGSIDDKSSYVYLSDGGHFENLGLYEMVLRRCRFIVVSDASTDPDYSFQSLAMSIRQIRVDLGVPIEMPDLSVDLPSQELKGKYCAVGTIRYSCVDRDPDQDAGKEDADFDGTLIYIKPSLIGAEPRDVVNYWQDSNGFPQEVITDQWFSEAQFESYRALGSHIIDAICDANGNAKVNFHTFKRKAELHNQLDFRAYRERVGYAALEKAALVAVPSSAYSQRVGKFINNLLGK